jgi:hypothetical protein
MEATLEKTKYKVIRTVSPIDALKLVPWFTDRRQSKADCFIEAFERMLHQQHNTCVCLVLDGDEVKGIAVAYGRDEDAWIWESHSSLDLPRKVVDEVLDKLIEWAKGRGYTRISGKPLRAAKLYVRRWGFKTIKYDYGTEIYKDI